MGEPDAAAPQEREALASTWEKLWEIADRWLPWDLYDTDSSNAPQVRRLSHAGSRTSLAIRLARCPPPHADGPLSGCRYNVGVTNCTHSEAELAPHLYDALWRVLATLVL